MVDHVAYVHFSEHNSPLQSNLSCPDVPLNPMRLYSTFYLILVLSLPSWSWGYKYKIVVGCVFISYPELFNLGNDLGLLHICIYLHYISIYVDVNDCKWVYYCYDLQWVGFYVKSVSSLCAKSFMLCFPTNILKSLCFLVWLSSFSVSSLASLTSEFRRSDVKDVKMLDEGLTQVPSLENLVI